LRTTVNQKVAVHQKVAPANPNEIQVRALVNVVAVQVVREVLKKFIKNVNPEDFFKNAGDEKKLATLIANECKQLLGPGTY
jgi:signal recognition particle GTPase